MTEIEHLQRTGIRRHGSPQKGFRYKSANGQRSNGRDMTRIQNLKIPPAWTHVSINSAPNAKLQAIGRDAAGRWQYLYHEHHIRRREIRKFRRLIKFAEALPKLRLNVSRHLRQTGLGRERVMSCILRILSTCFMRPGSEVYASENGSYGLATLLPEHVKVKGEVVDFDFPGKSGVRQKRQVKDAQVAKVVRALLKQRAKEVFKFRNETGEFIDVKSRHINEYIKEVMGKNSLRKRKLIAAIRETAEVLGNTPAVCRGSYICPEIISNFEKGKIIDNYFETLEELISYSGRKLHPAEDSLLKFLKRSAIQ